MSGCVLIRPAVFLGCYQLFARSLHSILHSLTIFASAVQEGARTTRRLEALRAECDALEQRLESAQAEEEDGEGATQLLVEGLRQSMTDGAVERDRLRELVDGMKLAVAGGTERNGELRDQVRVPIDRCQESGPGGNLPAFKTAHDHMILREDLVGSHGRGDRPCLQTAHMTI